MRFPTKRPSQSEMMSPSVPGRRRRRPGLLPAIRINGSLQCLHRGEPKGYRGGFEAAKRRGQRQATGFMAVDTARRPGKSRLDEHANRNGRIAAYRKDGEQCAGRKIEDRRAAANGVDLCAVRGNAQRARTNRRNYIDARGTAGRIVPLLAIISYIGGVPLKPASRAPA
jgi:hypothetical protein